MTLVNQDGKLLLRNGALATGQGCCCGGGGGGGGGGCSGPCVDCWEVLYECRYGECFGQNNPWPDGGSNDPGIAEVKVTVAGQFPSRAEAQEFIDTANLDDFYCDPFAMTGPDLSAQGFTDCKLTSGPTLSMQRCLSISEAPCPEGCKCCDGKCVPLDKCCGPCDEQNPCPPGCQCVDGECVTPVACDCGANSPSAPFPLPDGKSLSVQVTLKPKEGLASIASDLTFSIPMAHRPSAFDYENTVFYLNPTTGQVSVGIPSSDFSVTISALIRCTRGGGYGPPNFQGTFYLLFFMSDNGIEPDPLKRFSFGYRENGEWVYDPENGQFGIQGFGAESWGLQPVVQDGFCAVTNGAAMWPEDSPSGYSCEDVGLCAEIRMVLE
jgi:hypothetical protein